MKGSLEVEAHHEHASYLEPVNAWPLLSALALLAFMLAVSVWRVQPPDPKGIAAALEEFSASRAAVVLRNLLAEEEPHPVGSEANARVRARIVDHLAALGYEAQLQETFVCGAFDACAPVTNILARLPGRESGPTVMLAAHYDSVRSGPGVADDGAGVAAILEIARTFKHQPPPRNSVIFLFSDGEEPGMLGAKAFVSEHPWAHEVGAVINLEARGTSGPSVMFETSGDNAGLVTAYATSVAKPMASSLYHSLYRLLSSETDLTVFKQQGLAGMNLAFFGDRAYYHTPLDDFAHLDLASLQHQGDNTLALAYKLAETDLTQPSTGNAVYMDVLSWGVLWWPESWTMPLVILIGGLLVAVVVNLRRKKDLAIRSLGWGIVAWLLVSLVPVLMMFLLQWIIRQVTGVTSPWYAYPWPMRLTLWGGTLFFSLATVMLVRRVRFWEQSVAVWLGWLLLTGITTVLWPGLVPLVLVPTAVGILTLVLVCFTPLGSTSRALRIVGIIAALVTGALWLPIAVLIESALGLDVGVAIALPLALVMSTLIPLAVRSGKSQRAQRVVFIASASVLIIGTTMTILTPTYSETHRQQLNILYFEDRDLGTAYWAAETSVVSVQQRLQQTGHFTAAPSRVLPWTDDLYPAVITRPLSLPAPELTILVDNLVDGERILKVRLQAAHGDDLAYLIVPKSVSLLKSSIEGQPSPANSEGNDFWFFGCSGIPAEGIEIELHMQSDAAVEVMLVNMSAGLPAGGEELLRDLARVFTPYHDGNLTMAFRRFQIQPLAATSSE